MVTEHRPVGPDLGRVLGMGVDDVRARFGSPESDRSLGRDQWIVYATEEWRLRLRCEPRAGAAAPSAVRSWTLDLAAGFPDLPAALETFGLRAIGPVAAPAAAAGRLLRCELEAAGGRASLTARVQRFGSRRPQMPRARPLCSACRRKGWSLRLM